MSNQEINSLIEEITIILKAISESETTEATGLLDDFEEKWINKIPCIDNLIEEILEVIGNVDSLLENN